MGERLVVEIKKDGKRIGNVYYHHSAYTLSSLEELSELVSIVDGKCFERQTLIPDEEGFVWSKVRMDSNKIQTEDILLKIILALSKFGGGLNEKDVELAKERWKGMDIPVAKDRNIGIVSISEETMDYSDSLKLGGGFIDVVKRTCGTDCFYSFDEEEYEEEYDVDPSENCKDSPYNLSCMSFEDIDGAKRFIGYFDVSEKCYRIGDEYCVNM